MPQSVTLFDSIRVGGGLGVMVVVGAGVEIFIFFLAWTRNLKKINIIKPFLMQNEVKIYKT